MVHRTHGAITVPGKRRMFVHLAWVTVESLRLRAAYRAVLKWEVVRRGPVILQSQIGD
jgi:hypothetical protein